MAVVPICDNLTIPDAPKAVRRFANGDEILGRYVVESELGQGGMGVVYKCFDKIGGVEVAVKGLPPEVSHNFDEMEAVRENFQLVSELHHSNIAGVRTLEKDAATGDYYLVMTLARGVSLRHWLRQHGGREHRAEQLNVLRQIASALDYAHNAEPKHIIHRDIKPENVMVDEHGNVAVLDFGLAAQVRSSLSRVSQVVTSRSGTPAYKSPEQWLAQAQRATSDQYSLGVIAYQMFAGELPFDSEDIEILKHAVVFDPVPAIPVETKSVNAAFAKALAKKPQERFASCEDFVNRLSSSPSPAGGKKKLIKGWVLALIPILALAFVFLTKSSSPVRQDRQLKAYALKETDELYELDIEVGSVVHNDGGKYDDDAASLFGSLSRIYKDKLGGHVAKFADLDFRDKMRFAMGLAGCGCIKTLDYLLRKKLILVNDVEDGGLLHWAAYCGRIDMMAYLIDQGADVSKQDKDGQAPLSWASGGLVHGKTVKRCMMSIDAIEYLIKNGADLLRTRRDKGLRDELGIPGDVDPVKWLREKVEELKREGKIK